MAKVGKTEITSQLINEMIDVIFSSPLMLKAHHNKKCTLFDEKARNKKPKEDKANQHFTYEFDWKCVYKKGVDEFNNTCTECGIYKLGVEKII